MASIPVKDLGPMVGMPYVSGTNASSQSKNTSESGNFEAVWSGQMKRNTQTNDLSEQGKKTDPSQKAQTTQPTETKPNAETTHTFEDSEKTQETAADSLREPEEEIEKLEEAITEKTKAIVTVDLGGVICDYDKVFEIVERKRGMFKAMDRHDNPLDDLASRIQSAIGRVAVVADDAHSLGASRVFNGQKKYCGAIADFTSFSFHAVKNFTTAEGGAATWLPINGIEDSEIYHMYQLLSLHGQSKDALAKTKIGAWEYDIVGPWYKCNMTDIMAGIGLRQLDRYDRMLKRRGEIIVKYDAICDELGVEHLVHSGVDFQSSNHLYLTRIHGVSDQTRREIIIKLAEHGVNTNVHYKPLPMMTAYKALGWDIKEFSNAYNYYESLITLPLHTCLSDEDVDYVIEIFREVVREYL